MLDLKIRPILLSILLAVPLAAAAAQPGSARTAGPNYDGPWSVLIVTDAGSCDRSYRYPVQIAGGRIHYQGGGAAVSGQVDRNGRVAVSLRSGGAAAVGSGRLSGSSGSGRWQGASADMRCSGRW